MRLKIQKVYRINTHILICHIELIERPLKKLLEKRLRTTKLEF